VTTSTASGSVEIDVPVETVFVLVSDLERFMRVVPAIDSVAMRDVASSADGTITSYAWTAGTEIGPFRTHMRGTSTREQLVPNQHLVYRHAMGLHTVEELELEPTEAGTRLRFTGSVSSPIPGLDRLWLLVASKGKGHQYYVDLVLAAIKRELETGHDEPQAAGQQASDPQLTAVGRVMKPAFGVPSGPLGWVSTRMLMPLIGGSVYQDMAEALHLRQEDVLLDVGCGSGAFLARHASHVHRVAGIDLSGLQIELARRHLGDRIAAGTADIIQGDAAALPWPDDTFTVVTSMESFAGFPDPEQVLAEMFRVLRPGGRLVVNIGEAMPAGTPTQRRWGLMWLWADDTVQRMVEQAGFTDVTLHYTPAWGDDPMSKAMMKLMDRLGAEARDLRSVSATKK
jgi:SAM-dependent methyltransferase/carbon monoxide dehydrogenase subunit G